MTATQTAPAVPIGTFAGLPLYQHGTAPAHLRTVTRLAAIRLKPAPGQRPVCYVIPYYHPDERRALYEPAAAAPILRSLGDEWAWRARRTCPRCGEVREYVVHGKQCGKCHQAGCERAEKIHQRRCSDCRRVAGKPLPMVKIGFYPERLCRSCVAKRNRQKEALLRAAIRCTGGCGKRVATKAEVLAWALKNYQAIARWERRCASCQGVYDAQQARLNAEREARWAKERAEQAERDRQARDARAREVAELAAWAAAALTDPSTVILDTETTGLSDDARIVDIAVVAATGETLLDTLVNPGEPIPSSATDIHGITDAMVAAAPTFGEILPGLENVVRGKRVLIYNRSYDVARLAHESRVAGPRNPQVRVLDCAFSTEGALRWMAGTDWEDVMVPYSDWYGDWSDWHGNYAWQPLNGGHRALGDCLAVIDCLKAMAGSVSGEQAAVA